MVRKLVAGATASATEATASAPIRSRTQGRGATAGAGSGGNCSCGGRGVLCRPTLSGDETGDQHPIYQSCKLARYTLGRATPIARCGRQKVLLGLAALFNLPTRTVFRPYSARGGGSGHLCIGRRLVLSWLPWCFCWLRAIVCGVLRLST